jgi:hypothetical protein
LQPATVYLNTGERSFDGFAIDREEPALLWELRDHKCGICRVHIASIQLDTHAKHRVLVDPCSHRSGDGQVVRSKELEVETRFG